MNFSAETLTIVQRELAQDFNISETGDPDSLLNGLAGQINHLIQTDFNRLMAILYRIDISENTLGDALKQHPGSDAGLLIARLLVERQLQKINMRRQFRSGHDIPDDEKW